MDFDCHNYETLDTIISSSSVIDGQTELHYADSDVPRNQCKDA